MLQLIFMLAILTFLFWMGFHITGALLSAAIWLCFKLPIALLLGALGLACCITLLLIPVGMKLFGLALHILI